MEKSKKVNFNLPSEVQILSISQQIKLRGGNVPFGSGDKDTIGKGEKGKGGKG